MFQVPSNLASLRCAWQAAQGLRQDNVMQHPCFTIDNSADTPKVYVSGMIGGWDMDAEEFVREVHSLAATEIEVYVNSPGGFVWDALSMYEALKSHSARVSCHVTGIAASAASFVVQAGDERVMGTGTRMMIHDAQVIAIGSPSELREMADLSDAISDDIASVYAERSGADASDWRAAMTATTWYSAADAVEAGLADRVNVKPIEQVTDRLVEKVSNAATEDVRSQLIRARARVALGGVQ